MGATDRELEQDIGAIQVVGYQHAALQGKKHWDVCGSSLGTENVQTTYAIWQGCKATCMDSRRTLSATHIYGARNQAIHIELNELVMKGTYTDITHILYNDLQDLPGALPVDLIDQEENMQATIGELRDKWFDIDDGEIDTSCW